MEDFPGSLVDNQDLNVKVFDLIGPDLLDRKVWGESYEDKDFIARDHWLAEANMIIKELESEQSQEEIERLHAELDRITRIAAAMNQLQAYTLQIENDPDAALLRREQIQFMRNICDFFEFDAWKRLGGHNTIPTGVGKTVIFNEVIYATGLNTLVVAETEEQVKQNHAKLHEHARGREIDSGIFYGKEKSVGRDVTYITYDSLRLQLEKPPEERQINPEDFDMLIFDEAHRGLSEKRRDTLDHFKHAIKMGFTATDRYDEDKQVANILPINISDMRLEEAEDKKLVAPHRNIIVRTDQSMRHVPVASTGDYAKDILYRSINTDERNLVVVQTYAGLHFGKRVINYCGGIQHAKDLAKMYRDHNIPAEAVWGDMPDEDRRKVFERFRQGKIWHITNADLVTTGFDMKSVEAVYMVQPSVSELRVMQIAGRSNRLWEELPDKVSYVVQFIDSEYSTPPVIFAEEQVGGSAMHGWDGFIFPELDTSEIPYTVITDPSEIEAIGDEHYARRLRSHKYPPDGWISYSELIELSGYSEKQLKNTLTLFRKELKEIRDRAIAEDNLEEVEENLFDLSANMGNFSRPEQFSGRRTYLSPPLVEQMARFLEHYEVRPSTAWRRQIQVAEILDCSISWINTVLLGGVWKDEKYEQLRKKFVTDANSARLRLYMHEDLIRYALEKRPHLANKVNPERLSTPPEDFITEPHAKRLIDAMYGDGAYELALQHIEDDYSRWGNNSLGLIDYEVDGKIVYYYSNYAFKKMQAMLMPNYFRINHHDPEYRQAPLSTILEQYPHLLEMGASDAMIQEEAELLHRKSPELFNRLKRYYRKETGKLEYYGDRQVTVHIFERVLRRVLKLDEPEMREELEEIDYFKAPETEEEPEVVGSKDPPISNPEPITDTPENKEVNTTVNTPVVEPVDDDSEQIDTYTTERLVANIRHLEELRRRLGNA